MTSPELHAEDLLDREARGALSAEERARLESHLVACSVCRFERQVRADFREEFESLRDEAPRPAPRVGRLIGWMVAGLLLAGVAGAEWARARQAAMAVPIGSANEPELAVPSARTKRARRPSAATVASAAQPSAEPEGEPSLDASAVEGASSAAPSSVAEASARNARRSDAVDTSRAASSRAATTAAASASALFTGASAARERGDYDEAARQYGVLIQLYPSSIQASTARAVLGRLLLDRGDPGGALSLFDAYLSSGETTLREEVLLGRALALGKLSSREQEAAAWRALLQAYPSSVHAERARLRLQALDAQ